MITFYRRTKQDKSLKTLPRFRVGCWVSVQDPSPEELDTLSERLGLDPDVLMDGLDPDEIPRIETGQGKVYVLVKTIVGEELDTLLIVLGESFILTLCRRTPGFLQRMISSGDVVTTQRLKTLIKMLAYNDLELEMVTNRIIKEVQKKRAFEEIDPEELNDLLRKEAFLNSVVSLYYNTRLVYTRLLGTLNFYEQDRDIIESLIHESEERYNLAKNALKTLSNLREYYLIVSSNKLNRMINILTVLTVLISIPAAVSGVYGMNILLPLQKDPNAFAYIMGIIIVFWAVFVFYVKKNRLL